MHGHSDFLALTVPYSIPCLFQGHPKELLKLTPPKLQHHPELPQNKGSPGALRLGSEEPPGFGLGHGVALVDFGRRGGGQQEQGGEQSGHLGCVAAEPFGRGEVVVWAYLDPQK